jgi:hypothetical protein
MCAKCQIYLKRIVALPMLVCYIDVTLFGINTVTLKFDSLFLLRVQEKNNGYRKTIHPGMLL